MIHYLAEGEFCESIEVFESAEHFRRELQRVCFRDEGLNDKLHLTPWMLAAPSPYGRRITTTNDHARQLAL
jgi:hypothetical protein